MLDGAFAVLLEEIPDRFAEYTATRLSIPTIVGIGAGPGTSRRPVLIWDNVMIRNEGKVYAALPESVTRMGNYY